jgi:hypothetical protein
MQCFEVHNQYQKKVVKDIFMLMYHFMQKSQLHKYIDGK